MLKIEDVIRRRRNHVDIELFFDVELDPSIDTIREGVELMRKFEPDCIIALGGDHQWMLLKLCG